MLILPICAIFCSEIVIREYLTDNSFYIFLIKAFAFLILISPLHFGVILWFCETSKGNKHKIYEALGFYTSPKLIIRCIFHRFISLFIFSFSILPSLTFTLLSVFTFNMALKTGETIFLALTVCLIPVSIALFMLLGIFSARWAYADLIFVTNPELSVIKSFKLSAKLTKGKINTIFLTEFISNLLLVLTFFLLPVTLSLKSLFVALNYTKICKSKGEIN